MFKLLISYNGQFLLLFGLRRFARRMRTKIKEPAEVPPFYMHFDFDERLDKKFLVRGSQ